MEETSQWKVLDSGPPLGQARGRPGQLRGGPGWPSSADNLGSLPPALHISAISYDGPSVFMNYSGGWRCKSFMIGQIPGRESC